MKGYALVSESYAAKKLGFVRVTSVDAMTSLMLGMTYLVIDVALMRIQKSVGCRFFCGVMTTLILSLLLPLKEIEYRFHRVLLTKPDDPVNRLAPPYLDMGTGNSAGTLSQDCSVSNGGVVSNVLKPEIRHFA